LRLNIRIWRLSYIVKARCLIPLITILRRDLFQPKFLSHDLIHLLLHISFPLFWRHLVHRPLRFLLPLFLLSFHFFVFLNLLLEFSFHHFFLLLLLFLNFELSKISVAHLWFFMRHGFFWTFTPFALPLLAHDQIHLILHISFIFRHPLTKGFLGRLVAKIPTLSTSRVSTSLR